MENPDEALELWYYFIITVLDKHAPIVTKRVKNKYQPEWYSDEIRKTRFQRDYFHQKKDNENYKKYRNKTNNLIRSAKTKFFCDAIDNDRSCKIFWKHLKDINATSRNEIDFLSYEGQVITEKNDIVNCLNEHFSSVGEKLISNAHTSFESEQISNYVNSKVNDDIKFSLYTVTTDQVLRDLKNLD